MLTRFEQKKQAVERIEEALTQLWNVYLLLYSYREGSKILEAWNLAFDVKEELRIELEERRNKKNGNKKHLWWIGGIRRQDLESWKAIKWRLS